VSTAGYRKGGGGGRERWEEGERGGKGRDGSRQTTGNGEEERDERKVRREEEGQTGKEVQNCYGVLNSQGIALIRLGFAGQGERRLRKESELTSTT
jgi:hypothetical protein